MNKPLLIFFALICMLAAGCKNSNYAQIQNGNDDKPIIIIGDTQHTSVLEFWREKNEGVSKKIFDKIADENPICILHCGDMVFNGSSEKEWNIFDQDASAVLDKKIPIYPVMGNHEYFGNNKSAMKNVSDRYPFLINNTWYSKRIKNLGVIFLNSNFDELTDVQNEEQINWYKNELEKFQNDQSVSFVIVICHHPPFTNSKVVSDEEEVQNKFAGPFMSFSKTGIFLSGHCHSYERFEKDGKYFIVSGGGGGPRQELMSKNRIDGPSEVFHGPAIRNFNYCRINVNAGNLVFQMIQFDKENGNFSVGETFELTR